MENGALQFYKPQKERTERKREKEKKERKKERKKDWKIGGETNCKNKYSNKMTK